MRPETAKYIEDNKDEINKRAYDGDVSAMQIIKASHLLEAALRNYKRRLSENGTAR